jgi:hypothetical protein
VQPKENRNQAKTKKKINVRQQSRRAEAGSIRQKKKTKRRKKTNRKETHTKKKGCLFSLSVCLLFGLSFFLA